MSVDGNSYKYEHASVLLSPPALSRVLSRSRIEPLPCRYRSPSLGFGHPNLDRSRGYACSRLTLAGVIPLVWPPEDDACDIIATPIAGGTDELDGLAMAAERDGRHAA